MLSEMILRAGKCVAWMTATVFSTSSHLMTKSVIVASIPGIIPGESNLKFCHESRPTDLFAVERISVHPTPPLLDEYIDIYLYGTFLQNINKNATWKWYIRDIYQDGEGASGVHQFCDAMEWVEQPDKNHHPRCPPEKGFPMLSVHTWVPWFVGEGNYTVKFDAKTKEGERIYCFDGEFELAYPENSQRTK
ncbi:Phosphatidylglycerol/phosphatidylinositol transfer protein [Cadophora gregata]|uniref:Phosphatidylglycerol/phosphatidylinositol transfer protein n=1 Tax=Cadophora gregata TaxID=51156 RepID=UPI0026DC7B15|nr:Phosphatidylglycerol/phosphatidylinositol transfer protein [Cadophora gregata]KAK0101066.1 Phosphatidylglycerol/phosphatidylinositol transfer protein [Cadophora gregata f. sp. sojae]KAK0115901.1 Phosphatidylglycerol/phosphatidylinositol transfer protein [Cadophora gregata]